jgi:hypothetical protein
MSKGNRKVWVKTFAAGLATGSLGLGALALPGCMSMQSPSVQDTIQKGQQPYVEAFIEYSGPQSKWAGSATWVLHVNARDAANPQVSFTPRFVDEPQVGSPRGLASEKNASRAAAFLRTELAELASTVQNAGEPIFRGCLYPVRIRMVREDGALLERQGCRSSSGWARNVSESVSRFLASNDPATLTDAAVTQATEDLKAVVKETHGKTERHAAEAAHGAKAEHATASGHAPAAVSNGAKAAAALADAHTAPVKHAEGHADSHAAAHDHSATPEE